MTQEANQEKDILSLSDEDFANLSEPSIPDSESTNTEEEENTKPDNTSEYSEDNAPPPSEEEDVEEDNQAIEESDEEIEESSSDSNSLSEEEVDYVKTYKEIFGKPFKANGREMQVHTTEEVIQLMQMGANYNKKMAAIKQQLPYLKMLEKNNLLDEKELSFLIDLKEKKPEAIAKLLQDSEIDLYDFDAEQLSNGYAPTNRAVSPKEIEIEEVLSSITDSPQYNRTVTTLGNEWDEVSRNKIVNQPEVIKVINEHMESGLFDTIQNEVDRLRMLGKLNGVSDFDAYDQVGALIFQQQGNMPPQDNQNQGYGLQQPNNLNTYNPQHQQELARRKQEELQRKKKAASSNVRKNPKQTVTAIDILNLSDEEIERLGNPNFI